MPSPDKSNDAVAASEAKANDVSAVPDDSLLNDDIIPTDDDDDDDDDSKQQMEKIAAVFAKKNNTKNDAPPPVDDTTKVPESVDPTKENYNPGGLLSYAGTFEEAAEAMNAENDNRTNSPAAETKTENESPLPPPKLTTAQIQAKLTPRKTRSRSNVTSAKAKVAGKTGAAKSLLKKSFGLSAALRT